MPVIKLSDNDLESKIPSTGSCVVDYYADWCGPCNMLSPVLDRISDSGKAIVIKVDIDKLIPLAKEAGVTSIPMLQFYKDGKLTQTLRGAQPEHVILKHI